jgi:ParB-like chromosome segregation protein Spo0J
MEHEVHPVADIFPLMSAEELNDLGGDMLAHGQREPIWIYQGKILDGRNRYKACLLKGIEPRLTEYIGPDAVAFAVSMNLKRRHLDDSQRSMVAAKLATLKRGDNQHAPNGGTTQARAAGLLNVSKRGIQRARSLIEDGDRNLVTAVEHGEVTISAAAGFVKSTSPQDRAKLIDEQGSVAAAVKAALKAKADRAVSKTQRPLPDPKRAADRADRQSERCRCVDEMLLRFDAMESSGTAPQVANAVKQRVPELIRKDAVHRLRRLAAFARDLVDRLEPSGAATETAIVTSVE